ncbi:hypothetical protein RHAL1_02056 [Beijerinckiaceae bacterium RH AL1]|nr:hypothetical protein RHAL1_02056 [Beijerinckiaceae bacterium RH AL1]
MAPEPQVDPRFRALLTAEDWARLPAPVQRRFSQRLEGGASHIYRGEIVETTMSRAGHWLSQIARLVGAPLPLWRDDGVAAVVTVTEDVAGNGQHWTRVYARRGGFPQIVRSSKRFAGPTGLEELVGYGLGMALVVEAQADALVFRSAAYFVDLGLVRLTVPGWLTPGALTNTHREGDAGAFCSSSTSSTRASAGSSARSQRSRRRIEKPCAQAEMPAVRSASVRAPSGSRTDRAPWFKPAGSALSRRR